MFKEYFYNIYYDTSFKENIFWLRKFDDSIDVIYLKVKSILYKNDYHSSSVIIFINPNIKCQVNFLEINIEFNISYYAQFEIIWQKER